MHPHIQCTLSFLLRVMRALDIGSPLRCRGSACVEVMTTLHGSAPSLQRHVGGCVQLEGMIAPTRDPLQNPTLCLF